MSKFNVGDFVTKVYGKKPAILLNEYSRDYWQCKYLHNNSIFYDYSNGLKLYTPEENEMTTDKQTLYSFDLNGKVAYGTHIGTNSQNQYLIEEKGTGVIHVFDKKDLEEVVPYTFSASIGCKETHYVGTPGALKKGDVLLYTGSSTPQVAVVTSVDTKNKAARAKFKGSRIVTESI